MAEGKQYRISLWWSEEQHAYIAQADDLPGVTGKGDTKEHAVAAVEDAIRWRLEASTEGTHPPAPEPGAKPQQP
jgi:predicted RNase H-like HicB family nuclease